MVSVPPPSSDLDGLIPPHRPARPAGVPRPGAPRPAPARFDVGVVGAGRVGAVLGAALRVAGHEVVAASAVSDASRDRAARLLPGVPLRTPQEVVAASQLVLLTVPDDALADLVSGLASLGCFRPGQLLVHTAGRVGIEVLRPAGPTVVPLALHPAMTFTGTELDLERLADCSFAVTAPPAARTLAELLVHEIGATPVWVAEADRGLYHAALAHGANHLVTLVAQAQDLLRQAGIDEPTAMLRPLVEAALDNALRAGDQALTGPVARGDVGTVTRHLHLLRGAAPDVRLAYRALAKATALRARDSGRLAPHVASPLLDVLDKETP